MAHAISSTHIPPLQFAFMRELYSSMIMAMIAVAKEGVIRPERVDIPRLLILGTSGTFIPHTLYLIGLLLTSPNVAAIYTPLVPVFGGVLAVVTQTETFGSKLIFARWILSIAAVCAGAALIIHSSPAEAHHSSGHVGHGSMHTPLISSTALKSNISSFESNGSNATLAHNTSTSHLDSEPGFGTGVLELDFDLTAVIGNICLVGYVASFACFLFLQKSFLHKFPPMTLTTWGYSIGMVETGLLAFGAGQLTQKENTSVTTELALVLTFVVLVGTVLNYNLYTWANSVIPSSTVSLFHGINPVFTAILSYCLLDTDLTTSHIHGGLAIGLGLYTNMNTPRTSKSTVAITKSSSQHELHDIHTVQPRSPKTLKVVPKHKRLLRDF